MSLAKVRGIGGLRKDMRTGAVISTDSEGLEAARKRAQDAQTIQSLSERVDQLTSLVHRLLEDKEHGTKLA